MKINKGIWKTGVLAAAMTLVFAMFIMRVDDWSKGLGSGFVAYGQTGGSTGGGTTSTGCGTTSSGSSGTTTVCATKVIPQIVAGDGYKTLIQVINTGTSTVTVNGDFYNTNGSTSTGSYTRTDSAGATTSFVGTMAGTSLPANGILIIKAEKTTPGLFVNWGSISATGPVTVASAFDYTVGAVLYSRVGVSASPSDMKQFVIPRSRDTVTGQDVGFAVVNTGSTSATANVVLRGAAGQTLATKDLTLAAKSQTAVFASEFFGSALKDAAGTTYGFLTFTSTSSQFAALALTVEGASLASYPVERLQ